MTFAAFVADQCFPITQPERRHNACTILIGSAVITTIDINVEILAKTQQVCRILGLKGDNTAHGISTVKRRCCTLGDFDLFDGIHVDKSTTHHVVGTIGAITLIHTHAVFDHHDTVCTHATDNEILCCSI